jgi:hypothetical protein
MSAPSSTLAIRPNFPGSIYLRPIWMCLDLKVWMQATVLGVRRETAAIEDVTSEHRLHITRIQHTSKALPKHGAHMVQTSCVRAKFQED